MTTNKIETTKNGKRTKSSFDLWVKLIIAFFIGSTVTYGFVFLGLPFILRYVESVTVFFILTLLFLAGLFLFIVRYKEWVFLKIFGTSPSDFSELNENTQKLIQNFKDNKWTESSESVTKIISSLASWYSWFSFRNWTIRVFYTLFLAFGGLLGTLLLFNQNKIMFNQNKLVEVQNQLAIKQNQLFELQNYKIDTQNYLIKNQNLLVVAQNDLLKSQNQKIDFQNDLIDLQGDFLSRQNKLMSDQNEKMTQDLYLEEAARRSNLIVFLTDVLNRIEEELRDPKNLNRDLSNGLILRICEVSIALKPYRYLEDGKIIDKQISPERGQLFFALLESNLSSKTYDQIYKKSNFSYSELKHANLNKAHLNGVNLSFSNLNQCSIDSCELTNVNFTGAELDSANISNSIFKSCNLTNTSLIKSFITDCKFYHSALSGVNLDRANIQKSIINSLQDYEIQINRIIRRYHNFDSITYTLSTKIDNFKAFFLQNSPFYKWKNIEYFYQIHQKVGNNPIKINSFYIGRDRINFSLVNTTINSVEFNNVTLVKCQFKNTTIVNSLFLNSFFEGNDFSSIFVDEKTIENEFDREYLPGKKFIDNFEKRGKTKKNENLFNFWKYSKITIFELVKKK